MSESYLIEAGVDNYLLEDGSGQLLIDQRVETLSSTVGITESRNNSWLKNILNTVGLSEVNNYATGFIKQITDTLGLTESNNKLVTQYDYLLEDSSGFGYRLEDDSGIYIQDYPLKIPSSDTVGITEASQNVKGILRNIADTIGFTDVTNHIFGITKTVTQFIVAVEDVINHILTEVNFYGLEDGTGKYQPEDGSGGYLLDQLAILKYASSTIGLTDAVQDVLGPVKQILEDIRITGTNIRAMVMYRNTTQEEIGINESQNRLGTWKRNIADTIGLTEGNISIRAILHNIASTVGLTESSNKLRGRLQNISDTVGITEAFNIITGIVLNLADTVGLVEANNRIKSVFIDFDIGNFIVTASLSLSDFLAVDSSDYSDFTIIDSYNIGDSNINDTN